MKKMLNAWQRLHWRACNEHNNAWTAAWDRADAVGMLWHLALCRAHRNMEMRIYRIYDRLWPKQR